MAVHALPRPNSRWGAQVSGARRRLGAVGAAFRSSAAVAREHVSEHGYFFAAMASADAAGFVHSTFSGLIVMAGSFLAIEWRVSRGA